MSSLASQTISLILASMVSGVNTNIPMILGCCSSGTANTVYSFSDKATAIATLGQGALTEMVCQALTVSTPVRACRITQSAAGAVGTITQSGTGPAVSDNSSTPYSNYRVRITVTTAGTLGTSRVKYSLDGGRNWVENVPTAATLSIANTGLSFTMAAGSYVLGETYSASTTSPIYTTTELALAFAGVTSYIGSWDYLVLCGRHRTASAANTIAAAVVGQLNTWNAAQRYPLVMMSAGTDTAANVASTLSQRDASGRLLISYADADYVLANPQPGYVQNLEDGLIAHVVKAGQALISTDLGRVKSGAIDGIAAPSTDFPTPVVHDERVQQSLNSLGISTLRSYVEYPIPGAYFLSTGAMAVPPGNPIDKWQIARIVAKTQQIVSAGQFGFFRAGVRSDSDGKINQVDQKVIETTIQSALDQALVNQYNAEGQLGHVSSITYAINRDASTRTISGDQTIVSSTTIQTLGYVVTFLTTVGLSSTPPA